MEKTEQVVLQDACAVIIVKAPFYRATHAPVCHDGAPNLQNAIAVRSHHLSGSLGAGYEFGTSDEYNAAELLSGQTTTSKMKVSSFSVLYALSYKF